MDSYNKTVGSIERNLLSSARRMHKLGISQSAIDGLPPLEETLRVFSKAELTAAQEQGDGAPGSEGESSAIMPAA